MALVAWCVVSFVLGCVFTWLVLRLRRGEGGASFPGTPAPLRGTDALPAGVLHDVQPQAASPTASSTPAAPAPTHPRPAPPPAPRFDDEPYGIGSAYPLPDGTSPAVDYVIKANADDMTYVTPESPLYAEAQTDVWFISEHDARKAGFKPAGE